MVGIRFLYITLTLCCLSLHLSAQTTADGFAQRQMRQLALRQEVVEQRLSAAREEYTTRPCDSLGRVIHELEKQTVAIDEAIKCRETGEEKTIVIGLTGTGYFDMFSYQKFNDGIMQDYIPTDEDLMQGLSQLPEIK